MGEAKGTVLIAEDDLTLRDMYQIRLEAEDFRVLTAANGEEALRIMQKEKLDVVLLDIMMPKMNGLDVLEKMTKTILENLDRKIDHLAINVDKRFDVMDKRFDNHDKKFDILFKKSVNTEVRLDNIEKNMATKDDINNLTKIIDKFMKQVDVYYKEMLSLKVKVDRLEKWVNQIAAKIKIQLES